MKFVETDWLIIGSGAGGSTAFHNLTLKGKSVLMIEEGQDLRTISGAFNESITDRTMTYYRNGGITPVIGKNIFPFSEGRLLGGTTELNGALFWRTPTQIISDWQKFYNLENLNLENMDRAFNYLEELLNVQDVNLDLNYNLPSQKLFEGATRLGWKTVPARRLAPRCIRLNECGSGCPNHSKNSMSQSLIPIGERNGGQVRSNTKAIKIHCSKGSVNFVIASTPTGFFKIYCKNLVLSGGPLQSPLLLRNSSLISRQNVQIGFHLNTKILVKFPTKVDAEKATIFSHQIQEFLPEGILIMASNFKPEYVGIFLANKEETLIHDVIKNFSNYAIYTIQIRPKSYGKLFFTKKNIYPIFNLKSVDECLLKRGLTLACEALLTSGAVEVHLPIPNSKIENLDKINSTIDQIDSRKIEISSVHAMSSIPMRATPKDGQLDSNAKLNGTDNLFVIDASMLPSTIGESPQGTIMAVAHLITSKL
jgi:choline dehydrogenase-like flavoprotein